MTLEEVLSEHINRYPKMQIQDVVKLIYQNEFGGEHLVKDANESLIKLEQEVDLLKKDAFNNAGSHNNAGNHNNANNHKTAGNHNNANINNIGLIENIESIELFEDIGNNLARINLLPIVINCNGIGVNIENNPSAEENKAESSVHGMDGINVELATVNCFFVNTANSVSGNKERFEEKLEIFIKCCKNGLLPFSVDEVKEYLKKYKEKGYPPLSHSEIYRFAYKPSYRVVDIRYLKFFEIFNRIDSLLKTKDTVNIAIDGNCSSGKSTLADFIGKVYDCNIFHMDDFFLPEEIKTKERLNEPGGNVDYMRFKEEVIDGIKSGKEFQYQKYDCKLGEFREVVNVKPKRLNIIEGSYSMHPTLKESYDLKIFLKIDEDTQRKRILERNGADMYEMFVELWIPLENKYFSEMKIEEQSDLVYININSF